MKNREKSIELYEKAYKMAVEYFGQKSYISTALQ
jgi:hypothetical protein